MSDGRRLLTHSRMQAFKTCRRNHDFAYNKGWRPDRESAPLRFGGNFHLALDLRAQGRTTDQIIQVIRSCYTTLPAWADNADGAYEWQLECEIVCRMFMGYDWRWADDGIEVVKTEQQFDELPIINPETGRSTPTYTLAGKIDKIVKLPDGRLAVMEHKTTGDGIGVDSDFWRRLRLDQQITLYIIAARGMGYGVQTVLFDAIHKPGIRPKKLTKVQQEKTGRDRETIAEYGDRLTADIADRPDFYFAGQEVPRLESDLDEFEAELWQIQRDMRECEKAGRHFRNTAACLHPYKCQFFNICADVSDGDDVPEGFKVLDFVHPELEESNASTSSTPAPA